MQQQKTHRGEFPGFRFVEGVVGFCCCLSTPCVADVIYTCGFETPAYAVGTIDGQKGWTTAQATTIIAVPEMAIVTSGGPGPQAGTGYFSSTNGPDISTSGRSAFQAADDPSVGSTGPLVAAIKSAEAWGATAIEFSAYITAPTPTTSGTSSVNARHGMVLYVVDPTGVNPALKAAVGFQVRTWDRQVFILQWLDVGQLGVGTAGNYLINFTTPLTVSPTGYTQVSARWNRTNGMPSIKVGAGEWTDVVGTSTVNYTADEFEIVNTRGSPIGGLNTVSTQAYMDSLTISAIDFCTPDSVIPPVQAASGELAPYSFTEPRTWTLNGIEANSNGARLTVSARGSLGSTTRFLTLKADGEVVATSIFGAGSGASNCGPTANIAHFDIDPVRFAAMSADGSVEFAVESSINATSAGCAEATLSIAVQYERDRIDCNGDLIDDLCQLFDRDCDGNSVLDSCDIVAGAPDLNSNGVPDSCEPDCDGDLVPDPFALSAGLVPDCNGNSNPDSCDISAGSSADFDGNGVPDECKPDCNGNQIPDSIEISQGSVADCNGNRLPDPCEIASSPVLDCNVDGILDACQAVDDQYDCDSNGLVDSCEIAAKPSLDCNGNGNLDSCDLASGSPDCDSNGRIDSCDISGGAEDKNQNGKLDSCELRYGDLSLDGVINGADLGAMLALWNFVNPPYGDITGDGVINGADLGLLLSRWGPVP
jgi:hypothetical protein